MSAIIKQPTTLHHDTEFPLLSNDDTSLIKNKLYPHTVTLADGGRQPLFSGGIITNSEITVVNTGIAKDIHQRFFGQKILLVQILEGARPFCGQVISHLHKQCPTLDCTLAELQVSSYTEGSRAKAHNIVIPLRTATGDLHDLSAFDTVVILDDLLDLGNTILWLTEYLAKFKVQRLQAYFMLNKKRPRSEAVNQALAHCNAIYGRQAPDEWLVGFGLDINLPGAAGHGPLHLFRDKLPGGIYAFNNSIEQSLIKEYHNTPAKLIKQLQIYASGK